MIIINNLIALLCIMYCCVLIKKRTIVNMFFIFLLIHFCFGYVYYIDFIYLYKENYPYLNQDVLKENISILSLVLTSIYGFAILCIAYLFNQNTKAVKESLRIKKDFIFLTVLFLLLTLYLGFKYKTLSLTAVTYSLPLRLNGIIEISFNFLFPIFIYLLGIRQSMKYTIIVLYAIVVFFSFGSKYAAFVPLLTFISMNLVIDNNESRIKKIPIIIAISFIPLSYTIINPYNVRSMLNAGKDNSFAELVINSYESANQLNYSFFEKTTVGLYILSERFAGYYTFNQAMQIVEKEDSRLFQNPHVVINRKFPVAKGSLSTGFSGYFILYLNSSIFGTITSLVFIFLYGIILYFMRNKPVISLVFLLATFPIFVDGPIFMFELALKVIIMILFIKSTIYSVKNKKQLQ